MIGRSASRGGWPREWRRGSDARPASGRKRPGTGGARGARQRTVIVRSTVPKFALGGSDATTWSV